MEVQRSTFNAWVKSEFDVQRSKVTHDLAQDRLRLRGFGQVTLPEPFRRLDWEAREGCHTA
jgi:hypothetical protein